MGVTDVRGRLRWTSTARPARGSKITAYRHDDLVGPVSAAGEPAVGETRTTTPVPGGDDRLQEPKGEKLPPTSRLLALSNRSVNPRAVVDLFEAPLPVRARNPGR